MTVAGAVLLVNAVWDFVCFAAICLNLGGLGRCAGLADVHLGLWADEADWVGNRAAAATMAALLAQWALVRLRGAVSGPASDAACVDAAATYVLEAAFVAAGVMLGCVRGAGGWFVVVASAVCWALVVRECVEDSR